MALVSPVMCAALLAVMGSSSRVAQNQAVSLGNIRAAHQARAAAIRTLVIDEHTAMRRTGSETHEDSLYNQMQERVMRAKQAARERAVCEPTTPEELTAFEEHIREAGNEDFPEEIRSVLLANRVKLTNDRSVYDFEASRYYCKQTDLRDLPELAQEYGIPEYQLSNLTASKSLMGTAGYSVLINDSETVATLLRGGLQPTKLRRELLGIAPEPLLDWQWPATIEVESNGQIVARGTRGRSAELVFELTFSSAEGYPMTHLVQYGSGGTIMREVTLSEFRAAGDGTLIPFRSVEWKRLGAAGEQVTVRQVTSVEINSTLPGDAFRLPAGAHLSALEADAVPAYKTDQEALRR